MGKRSFEVGQLVAHRTADDVPWVVNGVTGDVPLVSVRRVRADGAVQDGVLCGHELVPYTDEPLAVAFRLKELLAAGDFSASLVEDAADLHDGIADELDGD